MKIGITCYPTYGGSGVVATELGIELAARGHQVHFITYSQPFRLTGREEGIFYHEVPVSNYPLFEYPPYDLALATRMSEVAEYYELDLLHVHYAIPHSVCALLARQMLAKRRHLPFVTTLAWHRHHPGRARPVVSAHYALRHRRERRRHFDIQLPARENRARLRHSAAHRSHSQLRQLRRIQAPGRTARGRPRALCRSGRKDPAPPFELPPGQAHPRCDRGLLPRRARDAGTPVDGRRRTGPLLGGVAGQQQRASRTGSTSWANRSGSTNCCR